jgi:ATP adenylyltransferase
MAFPTNPVSPTEILSNLPAKFDEARSSGQLFFFPSEAKDVYAGAHRVSLISRRSVC